MLALILSFLGALLGSFSAVWATYYQVRGSRRAKLEDAYAELGGALTVLVNTSIPFLFSARKTQVQADEAWARFGATQTRVMMVEHRQNCRQQVEELTTALNNLYSSEVLITDTGEAGMPSKEALAVAHVEKMTQVRRMFDALIAQARK